MELLPIYHDMLHGNCCCGCLEPFFEADGRTPTSKLFPDLCNNCASEFNVEARRLFYGTQGSYKQQRIKIKDYSKPFDVKFPPLGNPIYAHTESAFTDNGFKKFKAAVLKAL